VEHEQQANREEHTTHDQNGAERSWWHAGIVALLSALAIVGSIICVFAIWPGWAGAVGKKPWNYLDLFIVPLFLVVGAFLLDTGQRNRERKIEVARQERIRRETEEREKHERKLEDLRAQDAALQAYLDQMSALLIDKGLREEPDRYASTRVTARARTLAVLSQLDGDRKRLVLQFLREARLINRESQHRKGRMFRGRGFYPCIVGLGGADLSDANLEKFRLISTSGEEPVSLEGAILRKANLREADLRLADLRGVDLRGADLSGARLSGADLRGARYDAQTSWPERFAPQLCGAVADSVRRV
jgi:uncharacterized protein YjbI with pentapeptide repeats